MALVPVSFKGSKPKPPAINKNVAADVRRYIPDTPQTNPNSFPAYEFVEYPKMMLSPDGPYIDEETKQPIVVENETEEAEFRDQFPDARHVASNNSALNAAEREELETLRAKRVHAADNGKNDEVSPNPLTKAISAKPSKKPLKGRDGRPLPKDLD